MLWNPSSGWLVFGGFPKLGSFLEDNQGKPPPFFWGGVCQQKERQTHEFFPALIRVVSRCRG